MISFPSSFLREMRFSALTFISEKYRNSLGEEQWRRSVKIIGGDETEPSKVAHIISRKFATEFLGNLGNTFVISAQKQVVSKKKKRSSSKLSHILRPKSEILTFFLPKIRWSPKKKDPPRDLRPW